MRVKARTCTVCGNVQLYDPTAQHKIERQGCPNCNVVATVVQVGEFELTKAEEGASA